MKTPQLPPLAGMTPLGLKPKSTLGELSAVCAGQSIAGAICDSHGDEIGSFEDVRHAEQLVKEHNEYAALVAVAEAAKRDADGDGKISPATYHAIANLAAVREGGAK